MNSMVIFFLGLVAVVAGDKLPTKSYLAPQQDSLEYSSDESFEAPKYNFVFQVNDGETGNDFDHQEARDDDNTRGSYTVQLPDGRLQKVTYSVNGEAGYVAEVTYEGEAQYPESSESREYNQPRPSYSAPKPTYFVPESEESYEAPSYAPPRRAYGLPQ